MTVLWVLIVVAGLSGAWLFSTSAPKTTTAPSSEDVPSGSEGQESAEDETPQYQYGTHPEALWVRTLSPEDQKERHRQMVQRALDEAEESPSLTEEQRWGDLQSAVERGRRERDEKA